LFYDDIDDIMIIKEQIAEMKKEFLIYSDVNFESIITIIDTDLLIT